MIVFLLILHSLLAVALLGAITHQAISAWAPASRARAGTFIGRMRAVPATPTFDIMATQRSDPSPVLQLFMEPAVGRHGCFCVYPPALLHTLKRSAQTKKGTP